MPYFPQIEKYFQRFYSQTQMIGQTSVFPRFHYDEKQLELNGIEMKIFVMTVEEFSKNQLSSQKHVTVFKKEGWITKYKQNYREIHLNSKKSSKFRIEQDCEITFSESVQKQSDFYGIACDILLTAYKFSRKTANDPHINILLRNKPQTMQPIIQLVEAKNFSRQLVNGRGDIEGAPEYILNQILRMGQTHNLQTTVYKGQQLVDQGFRLLHAVGRASDRQPIFANITYRGDKDSDKFVAFIGKGVCFDAGGLDVKKPAAMREMFLDKQGAVTVLAAFQQIVKEKLKINITCSVGLVENYIGPKSYRPSDIIKSRKGLTVKIDDTDAQGRLVLADCMHWTQQTYQTQSLIELSTLTYSNILALGQKYAGMFSNSIELSQDLFKVAQKVHEYVWRMPVDIEHHEALEIQQADLLSDVSVTDEWAPGGSIAAAFLENFVEKGVQWVHLDIGGTSFCGQLGTGWGTLLLIEWVRSRMVKNN